MEQVARDVEHVVQRVVEQIVALGAYSHAALKDVVAATGIRYHRQARGIAHYFTDRAAFAGARHAAALMQRYGVERRVDWNGARPPDCDCNNLQPTSIQMSPSS